PRFVARGHDRYGAAQPRARHERRVRAAEGEDGGSEEESAERPLGRQILREEVRPAPRVLLRQHDLGLVLVVAVPGAGGAPDDAAFRQALLAALREERRHERAAIAGDEANAARDLRGARDRIDAAEIRRAPG